MIQRLYLVIWSSSILISSLAVAGDPICTPGKPDECTMSIKQGDPAPFSGQLMTNQMALSLGLKLEFETEKLRLEIEKTKAILGVEIQKEKDIRISNMKHCAEREKMLMNRIERPFFEHPVFVAFATAAAVLATVYVAAQLK